MDKDAAITIIKSVMPADFTGDKDVLAAAHLDKAVAKAGRMKEVDFNMRHLDFVLTANQYEYRIGKDIAVGAPGFWNITQLWYTSKPGWFVNVIGVDEFNSYRRGSDVVGVPQIATMHSHNGIFELWPTPDSAYTLWAYVRSGLNGFDEVPDQYRDIIVDFAIASVLATRTPAVAMDAANKGYRELQTESLTQIAPDAIRTRKHLGVTDDHFTPDSGALR